MRCTERRRTYSASWVGLGGYHTNARALEQTGTDADCDAGGGAHYDTISASVTVTGARVRIVLADRSTGARRARVLLAPALDVSSAEWIVEAPSVCSAGGCTVLALADFGTSAFTGARATSAGGHAGPISDPAWRATAIRLSAASARDLGPGRFAGDAAAATATPAALSQAGDAFAVTYAAAPGAASSPDATATGL